ncbi:MAG: sulfate transporter, partial [Pseudomonadota bacterium]
LRAVNLAAYVLSDSASWATFSAKGGHRVLVQNDPPMLNHYALVEVNPSRHPKIRADAARSLVNWLTGPVGQAAIASFQFEGQPVFEPVLENKGG